MSIERWNIITKIAVLLIQYLLKSSSMFIFWIILLNKLFFKKQSLSLYVKMHYWVRITKLELRSFYVVNLFEKTRLLQSDSFNIGFFFSQCYDKINFKVSVSSNIIFTCMLSLRKLYTKKKIIVNQFCFWF